jgi:hypothetical protein
MTGRKTFFCFSRFRDDVFIPANLNHALDKDIVKYVYNRRKEKTS